MNKPSFFAIAFTLLSIPLLFVGCETAVNTTSRKNPRANPNPVKAQEVVMDKRLGEKVRVVGVREATVSGDMLKIQADVSNTTRNPLPLGYRFEWFGPEGIRISSTSSGWQRRTLQGGETFSFTAVAPTPGAEDFQLKLIEADR